MILTLESVIAMGVIAAVAVDKFFDGEIRIARKSRLRKVTEACERYFGQSWVGLAQIHDGISQPSSFIFRFVQCCSCSKRAGSTTIKRRPARPPASAHTKRPFA